MMRSDLIFVVLIVGAIAYAVGWRPQFNQTGRTQAGPTPLDVLQARYARGEITRDEYDQMHRDLEG
jgi:putative membrane protein